MRDNGEKSRNTTPGAINDSLCKGIIRFEKEVMGRGPDEVKAYLVDDIVVLRLKGVLTKAEIKLLQERADEKEVALIKEFRQRLMEKNRRVLEEMVREATGRGILSVHSDLNVHRGERVIVFVLDGEVP
jgi:uncharacterized protein YbcI